MENKQDKGFTLVELLIVIVILGILATVTVFAVRGITDQGQESACDADLKTVQTATEAWFAQYGGDTIPLTGTYSDGTAYDFTGATSADVVLEGGGFLVDVSDNYSVSTAGVITSLDTTVCPNP